MLIWLAIRLGWVLSRRDLRSSLGSALRAFLHSKILLPLAIMVGYVTVLARLGSLVGIWSTALVKDTIVWFVVSGLALFMGFTDAAKQPHFFRNRIAAALGITAFLEFFTNLYVFPLVAELILLPFLMMLVGLPVVAGNEQRHRLVKKLAEVLLGLVGLSLLMFAVMELIANWGDADKHVLVRQLALPVWMTIGLLPFVYLLSLYATYEKAFGGVKFATNDRKARRHAELAIVTKLHFRHREVNAFTWNWAGKAARATNFAVARQVVSEFLTSRRDAERATIEEQQRLRRYVGSDEVDADGRRLDRREFKETMRGKHSAGTRRWRA